MNKMKLRLDLKHRGFLKNCEEAVYYGNHKNVEAVKIASRPTSSSEVSVKPEWLLDLESCKIPTGLEEGKTVEIPPVTVGFKMDTLTKNGSIEGFLGMDAQELKRFLGRFVNDPRFNVKLEYFVHQICVRVKDSGTRMEITPNQKNRCIFVSSGGGCGDWQNGGAGSDRTQRTSWTGNIVITNGSETFRKLWCTNTSSYIHSIDFSLALWIYSLDGPNPDIPDHLAFTRKMLADGLLADVTIIAGNGAEIKCHRSVLAAHSPVFAAMFRNDMKEARTGKLKMGDLSEESVRAFLDFLYVWKSRAAEESPSVCIDLLDAGHQYKVELLEKCMEKILLSKSEDWFTGDSLVRLILYLKNRDLEELKTRAMQLFESKYGDVKKLAAFQELQDTEAVAEVMKLISTARDADD